MRRPRRIFLAALILPALGHVPAVADELAPPPTPHAIAVVTLASSPISALNRAELSRLALGQQQALNDGTPVRFADLAPGPVRERFYRMIAQRNPAQMRAYWSRLVFTGRGKPPPVAHSGEELREWLQKDASLIGYLPASELGIEDDAGLRVLLRLD